MKGGNDIEFLLDNEFPGIDGFQEHMLRGILNDMHNLRKLSFYSRFGSDGPWDYPLKNVKLPKLEELEIDFISGKETHTFLLNNSSITKIELTNFSRDDINYRLPDNIKQVIVNQIPDGTTSTVLLNMFGPKRDLIAFDLDCDLDEITPALEEIMDKKIDEILTYWEL